MRLRLGMATGQAIDAAVQLDNIAVIRGGRLVLQQLSCHALAGDIIWLRGANGSGKSTLLRLIAGLLPLASGKREVAGRLAMADENLALDYTNTLEKSLALWAGMDGASASAQADAMAAFDLSALAEVPVAYLSAGQRKRAALARVLNSNAQIWLLDEPYNGLDNANSSALDDQLIRHARSGGIAVVAAHRPPTINVADTISLSAQTKIRAA